MLILRYPGGEKPHSSRPLTEEEEMLWAEVERACSEPTDDLAELRARDDEEARASYPADAPLQLGADGRILPYEFTEAGQAEEERDYLEERGRERAKWARLDRRAQELEQRHNRQRARRQMSFRESHRPRPCAGRSRAPRAKPVKRRGSRRTSAPTRAGPDESDPEPPGVAVPAAWRPITGVGP